MTDLKDSITLAAMTDRPVRVRLLVEADLPQILLFRHMQDDSSTDQQSFWRLVLEEMLHMPGTTITECAKKRRRPTRRVELACPDGTKIVVSSTGRPTRELTAWKDKGYVVDWRMRALVKAEKHGPY